MPSLTFAQAPPAFVSIVNPIRGNDFWELPNQHPETAVLGQIEILKQFNIPATWLIRFDALFEQNIVNQLISLTNHEEGLFLEVTPSWTNASGVSYRPSYSWHFAGSAFLTGYEAKEREKLIDTAFEKFKQVFGYYPKSVGGWWIDSYSLDYMQKKYGITAALIVADQYSTDNYQIWGQFWSTPYYPAKRNALNPAQSKEGKIDVVMMQWAPRDPVNGYGGGVFESTFSVQANDYQDFHNLSTNYFSKLVDIYTKSEFNKFGQMVVGLENSYDWNQYKEEYSTQVRTLVEKSQKGQFSIVPMKEFASWYKKSFPNLSPPHTILAKDPLSSGKMAVWFMNPYYRVGWFYNQDGSVFRDIRQYVEGEEEICFIKSCSEVNFATFPTRVLDDVTYGTKWIIDNGKISEFKIRENGDKYVISYVNEANKIRSIELLPRDLSVDGKIYTIDQAILETTRHLIDTKRKSEFQGGFFYWSPFSALSKTMRFLIFLVLVLLIPGLIMTNRILEGNTPLMKRIFLGIVTSAVLLTVIFYTTSLLNLRFLSYIYIFVALLIFLKLRRFILKFNSPKVDKLDLLSATIIIAGTIFQSIPTFKNGLTFPFGMGFWGPNTHDGVWHISLINQLIQKVPAENPIFADSVLKNYHYFYDLLVAVTAYFTRIPAADLVFRFYPILFSLLLGLGTYYLVINLFKDRIGLLRIKVTVIFSLYFVYFAGSFGWIVDYIKQKSLGGESAFWANQSISFNLNPPFAISLLIIIAFLILLNNKKINTFNGMLVAILLAGSLVGFKAYGAVLVIAALSLIAIVNIFRKRFTYLVIVLSSLISSLAIFLSNFQSSQQLIIFSPFWFIHSMIDSADRVGWTRLSLARVVGWETKNWFKFISSEIISLLLFIIGNLGMRFLSLVSFLKIKSMLKDDHLLFLLIFSLLSFLIPILFIQSGNPWNTIQFFYYGLYISSLVSGIVLTSLVFRLPKSLSILIVGIVLILTPINSITTSTYYLGYRPHARVLTAELEALEFLNSQQDGVVLTYPYDERLKRKIEEPWPLFVYDSTAYVSALSKKTTYLEDEGQNQILLTDYKKRLVASKDFFLKPESKFLIDNNIKYIYLPKMFNVNLNEDSLPIENIFENEQVLVYQLKP